MTFEWTPGTKGLILLWIFELTINLNLLVLISIFTNRLVRQQQIQDDGNISEVIRNEANMGIYLLTSPMETPMETPVETP